MAYRGRGRDVHTSSAFCIFFADLTILYSRTAIQYDSKLVRSAKSVPYKKRLSSSSFSSKPYGESLLQLYANAATVSPRRLQGEPMACSGSPCGKSLLQLLANTPRFGRTRAPTR